MTELPQANGREVIRALEKAEFFVKRHRGSHAVVVHKHDLMRRAIVPVHGSKDVKPGTLRAILRGAHLTVEEFKELL